ncbi:kinase binding protein CGI-121-domain-containing protein [Usnea florida]
MGRLRTRNVHSEIVFGLGVNNNISHSLSTFGLTPTTTSLLAIKLSTAPHITRASVAAHLQTSIEGTSVAFCDEMLGEMADVGRIRKELEVAILGVMALRGAG